jgi:hypothetical protein
VHFVVRLSAARRAVHFDPTSDPTFLERCSFFESVQLESAAFTITVFPGINRRVAVCANPLGVTPADAYESTCFTLAPGAQYGTTVQNWSLPHPHPFGRELKAMALGNPPPRFSFVYLGATGTTTTEADAVVRGELVLTLRGTGVTAPFEVS